MENLDLKELIKFDDGSEYYIVNRLLHNKDFYVLLSNKYDAEDIIIQKEVLKNNQILFEGITNEEDFKAILNKFATSTRY